jgi:uncharacterized membrane protein
MKTMWKEVLSILIAATPLVYLATKWTEIKAQVPMHWSINGEIDRYGSKMELLVLVLFMTLGMYTLLSIIPWIDPKKKIAGMGQKWYSLKLTMMLFLAALTLYIIRSSMTESATLTNVVFVCIGLLIAVLGNYMPTMKPNYFVGIRTPWTLQSETVWTKTHRSAAKLWFVAGSLLVVLNILVDTQEVRYLSISVVLMIAIIPIIQSYVYYREDRKRVV